MIRSILALLAALLLAPAWAATTAERSPFSQGHWWDPTRSGHGFEIFNAAGQVVVVWYTYDEQGNPTWYYGQGALADVSTRGLPLVQTRWADGRIATRTDVGVLRLTVRHPESIDLAWELKGSSATWSIKPFVASGVVNENDHSGHWYDPSNAGWGFTLIEQGDVLGAVLYAYDASGAPTWRAGFGRQGTQRRVDMLQYRGYCPSCSPGTVSSVASGTLTFDYRSDSALTVSSTLATSFAAGVRVNGANATQLGRPASARPGDRQLAAFGSDATLEAYLREGMLSIQPGTSLGGGADFSAGAPGGNGTAYSPTNLVEIDVDEAGLVKTDGRFVYTFAHNDAGKRIAEVRMVDVSDSGAPATVRPRLALAAGSTSPAGAAGLFRYDNRLVAITGSQGIAPTQWTWAPTNGWAKGVTNVEVFDATQPAAPASRWRASFDGHLIASRRIGERLFLVLRHVPTVDGYFPSLVPSAASRDAAMRAPLATLLPKMRVAGGDPVDSVATSSFYLPPPGAQPPSAQMTLVFEIDLAQPGIVRSLAVAGSIETVYASSKAIYLANTRTALRAPTGTLIASQGGSAVTDIHRLPIEAGLRVGSTGTVEGFLSATPNLAQFRLSEHDGRLRVVSSTANADWWGATRNRLTILEPSTGDPGLLKTVSFLPNAQRPQPLGLPQEQLYATRFAGERLYAITYGPLRQNVVDPVYVVDLSVATDPRIRGELVVPGFSEYLHPLAGGYLLGVGRHTTLQGADQGLKVSLYDVRDDALPREIDSEVLGWALSQSALETHHHAFSALLGADGSGVFAFPARLTTSTFDQSRNWSRSGLMTFRLKREGGTLALEPLPELIVSSPTKSPWLAGSPDYAATDARSVLFANGVLYVAGGWFYRRDAAGNETGPF